MGVNLFQAKTNDNAHYLNVTMLQSYNVTFSYGTGCTFSYGTGKKRRKLRAEIWQSRKIAVPLRLL